jgi:hypothetical protein
VRSSKGQKVTADCGIATTFERHDPVVAVGDITNVEFVGNVEEILELDY